MVRAPGGAAAQAAVDLDVPAIAHREILLTAPLSLLAEPLTPWQLAERVEWNRPWDQIPHGSRTIAVPEAEAHARRLVELGRADAVPGSEPVRYVRRKGMANPAENMSPGC